MKPNFALTLSFEGIRLLHRAPSGWLLVGDVAFDTADLDAEVAILRDKAARLDPDPMRCKLVIPNEQIKYLTVASTAKTEAEAEDDAAHALRGATPYEMNALAFDWAMDDGQLFIAAVARETLDEVETFAQTHQFNPVSFVALPEQTNFAGEPFFGVAKSARAFLQKTDNVMRDLQPIHVIGRAEIPEPDADLLVIEDEADTQPTPRAETPLAPTNKTPPTPPAATDAAPASSSPKPDTKPDDKKPDDLPEAPVPVAFSSVRASTVVPESSSSAASTTQKKAPEAPKPSNTPAGIDLPPSAPTPDAKPKSNITLAPVRKTAPAPVQPLPIPAAPPKAAAFSLRTAQGISGKVGGKPKHLGLILSGFLLIFFLIAAIWATFFSDTGLAGLFGDPEEIQIVETPTDEATAEEMAEAVDVQAAGDAAEVEGDQPPINPVVLPDVPHPVSPEEAARRYITTGIWEIAPDQPASPSAEGDAEVYVASIDPAISGVDAIALPDIGAQHDLAPAERLSPAAAGTKYDVDPRGLVKATPDGAMTPDGILVYAGRPALVPPKTPTRFAETPDTAAEKRLSGIRPKARPGNLQEKTERYQLGGRTRTELASLRPRLRPISDKQQAEQDETPTAQAVASSLKPQLRPASLSKIVKTVRATPEPAAKSAPASPVLPSSASVARQATVKDALNLRQVNLIGVYGKPSNRRALVRLSNGRYQKVQVGDRIDGGKVAAIGESELRYIKNGRDVVLKMPRG